eukprot:15438359-Alexandrium_andersonii.AAC.1
MLRVFKRVRKDCAFLRRALCGTYACIKRRSDAQRLPTRALRLRDAFTKRASERLAKFIQTQFARTCVRKAFHYACAMRP